MSNAPYALKKARFGYKLGDGSLVDLMVHDGLTSAFDGKHMVEQASFVARELGITREAQDEWALRSQQRAAAAQDEGRFDDEIVAVGEVTADEGPRRDTTLEKLAALKPVFDPEGTTTAGNAPGVNDGAGALVVTERGVREEARSRGAGDDRLPRLRRRRVRLPRPHARGCRERRAGQGRQVDRRRQAHRGERGVLLGRAQLRCELLDADPETVNVNGGAVALGHPIGASGARILSTMIYELRRQGGGLGLAAICSGGGQGDAILLEV